MLSRLTKHSNAVLSNLLALNTPTRSFSVTTTARVASQNELFYKRDLPSNLIPFSSPQGKLLFQEALKQGNMEAYFTLAENLITQAEPSTCGPTSLSMIINTLHIDPNKQWKGVWRWASEYNLYCCPEDYIKAGLNFEQFANLAHCNRTKVQAFYHSENSNNAIPLITQGEHSGKVHHCKAGSNHEGSCANKHGIVLKHGTYTTFLNNLVASSRRSGLYMVMNFSRQYLQQTGDGHYNPIAGIYLNGKRSMALILDLAKFKYPGYWVDLEVLYESMRPQDSTTGKSRGFCMISANREINPSAREISKDMKSSGEFKRHAQTIPARIDAFLQIYEKKYNKKPQEENILYMILTNLGKDCNYLFTYYLYDLSIRLESKEEGAQCLFGELENLEKEKLCCLIKSAMVMKYRNMNNHQIFWLVYDHQPALMANILTVLLYAFERFLVHNKDINLANILKEKNLSEPLKQEVLRIQRIFGLEE